MILLVSHEEDDHLQPVLRALRRLGQEVVVLDTADYPQTVQIVLRFGDERGLNLHRAGDGVLDLARFRSIWWRRAQQYQIAPEIIDPELRSWAYTEAHEAIEGMWRALDVFWLNDPIREEAAAHKPFQLSVAPLCGLVIPRTLITNSPEQVRNLVKANANRGTIYKTFLATARDWRETRLLRDEDLAALDSLRFTPVIFQEYIPAQVDLRITVVGHEIYPAAIRSQEPGYYPYDFRMDMERARYEPTELPSEVRLGIRRLMDRLGLIYGAIDMRRTPEGRHVFLEVNPSGQWLFVEERTGQPITEAVARALARGRR